MSQWDRSFEGASLGVIKGESNLRRHNNTSEERAIKIKQWESITLQREWKEQAISGEAKDR